MLFEHLVFLVLRLMAPLQFSGKFPGTLPVT